MLRTFVGSQVMEGAFLFENCQGIEVSVKREGGKPVSGGNSRKPAGNTVGQVSFSGTIKLLLDNCLAYVNANQDFMRLEHTFTLSIQEGAVRDKITVEGLVFTDLAFKLEGQDGITIDLPFTALDVLVNDVSLAAEAV